MRESQAERDRMAAMYPERRYWRPKTRGDCARVPRPCPYVSCKYNLYLDVQPTGSVKLNMPDLEPDEMAVSCALDVAEEDGATLERVAELLNITRERVRQIEDRVLRKLAASARHLRDYLDEGLEIERGEQAEEDEEEDGL
jgi:hypothetical protein